MSATAEAVRSKLEHKSCHAGAGHAPAQPRGLFGDLCDDCWARVSALLTKIRGGR